MRLLFVCVVFIFGAIAFAQDLRDSQEVRMTRIEIQAKRQTIVEQALDLTNEEQKAFWPLYRDWRAKSAGLGDRRVEIIQKIDEARTLTDQQAKELIDASLKLRRDHLSLLTDYVKRFRKILPDAKVARFFQLEGKLDAIVEYDLISRVPLLE